MSEDFDSFDFGVDLHSKVSFFVAETTETSCCKLIGQIQQNNFCRCQMSGLRPKEIIIEKAAKIIGLAAKQIPNESFNCNTKRTVYQAFKQNLKQVNLNLMQ